MPRITNKQVAGNLTTELLAPDLASRLSLGNRPGWRFGSPVQNRDSEVSHMCRFETSTTIRAQAVPPLQKALLGRLTVVTEASPRPHRPIPSLNLAAPALFSITVVCLVLYEPCRTFWKGLASLQHQPPTHGQSVSHLLSSSAQRPCVCSMKFTPTYFTLGLTSS